MSEDIYLFFENLNTDIFKFSFIILCYNQRLSVHHLKTYKSKKSHP